MRRVKAFLRGGVSLLLFALFAIGGLLLSPLMVLLRSPRLCQPVVRALWMPLVGLFRLTGIIGVKRVAIPEDVHGCIIAANHPSLIDVVLVTVLFPKTLYVAKTALLKNPFMAAIVRHTSLPVDERLLDAVVPYLRDGWNILVFPEGTRSPAEGAMQPLRRGVAQLVLRTGAPLVCLGISSTRRILGKRQAPWDVGAQRVVYSFRADSPTRHAAEENRSFRPQAIALTEEIRGRIEYLASSVGCC